jgi:hypothetical protein
MTTNDDKAGITEVAGTLIINCTHDYRQHVCMYVCMGWCFAI